MNSVVLASFIDELSKIAGANVASPFKMTAGHNVMTGLTTTKSGLPKTPGLKAAPAKPTNYSIVHSEAPSAAYGSALSSKSVPPPPVRT